jgi:SAM-dependent methyltransferase
MIGIGLKTLELQRNPQLTKFFVKDLKTTPNLSEIPSESTDIVICNVSVDYLTKPVQAFKEMNRVLKVGGTAYMAFSNRCFPTKVIRRWMGMSDEERRRWVGGYFWASSRWVDVEEVVLREGKGDVWGGFKDPLFVVRGRKSCR